MGSSAIWQRFIMLLISIITVRAWFYLYFPNPMTWHDASRICRVNGRTLINIKPLYIERITDNLANMALWQYGIEETYFWSIHRVKKSSVLMFAESDNFPYDNRLADDDEMYCALAVFYVNFNKTRWIASPCDLSYQFYCQLSFIAIEGISGSIDVFYDEKVDWNTANRRCREEGGDLTSYQYEQFVEYSTFFYYDTSLWQPYNQHIFWTGNKRLRASTEFEPWPITYIDVTMTSQHCIIGDTVANHVLWSTDNCTSLHSFICEMPAPTEDFYYFFEVPRLSVSARNNPFLRVISTSIASPQECEEICRYEIAEGLECMGFEVNHTSGQCITHAQYQHENEEDFQMLYIHWSFDTTIYRMHFIRAILGNSTQKTNTNKLNTETAGREQTTPASATFAPPEQVKGRNVSNVTYLEGREETATTMRTTTPASLTPASTKQVQGGNFTTATYIDRKKETTFNERTPTASSITSSSLGQLQSENVTSIHLVGTEETATNEQLIHVSVTSATLEQMQDENLTNANYMEGRMETATNKRTTTPVSVTDAISEQVKGKNRTNATYLGVRDETASDKQTATPIFVTLGPATAEKVQGGIMTRLSSLEDVEESATSKRITTSVSVTYATSEQMQSENVTSASYFERREKQTSNERSTIPVFVSPATVEQFEGDNMASTTYLKGTTSTKKRIIPASVTSATAKQVQGKYVTSKTFLEGNGETSGERTTPAPVTRTESVHLYATSYQRTKLDRGQFTYSNNLPFWLMGGFGALCTFVTTTLLGIIIKRSKNKLKIKPADPEETDDVRTANIPASGVLKSF